MTAGFRLSINPTFMQRKLSLLASLDFFERRDFFDKLSGGYFRHSFLIASRALILTALLAG